MILTYLESQKLFLFKCTYAQRGIPSNAGLRYDPVLKLYTTKDPDKAYILRQYASKSLEERFVKYERYLAKKINESSATSSTLVIPKNDNGKDFFEYQTAGIEFASTKNTLIADEMGLGKSIQGIGLINLLPPNFKRVLIICPNTVKLNWKRELESWSIHKDKSITISSGSTIEVGDIMIMNFEIFKNKITDIKKYNPSLSFINLVKKWKHIDLIIIDESHRLKNFSANTTKNIFKLKKFAKHIVSLTGTPILNKPEELWTTIKLLGYQNEFGRTKDNFVKRYCGATFDPRWNKMVYNLDNVPKHILRELQIKLRKTFMIRRLKSQVLNLPPKIRSLVPVEVKLDFLKKYSNLDNFVNEISGIVQSDDINSNFLSGVKPSLIDELSKFRKDTGIAKIPAVIEFVGDILDQDEKVVIFCHHKDIINEYKKRFPDAVIIYGDTPMKDRQRAIDEFQTNPDVKVFIGNFDSAGVGITLTASTKVVMAELYWHPFMMLQAEDRCYRIGTTNMVNVYYIVAENTLDSYIGQTVVRKLNMFKSIIETETL